MAGPLVPGGSGPSGCAGSLSSGLRLPLTSVGSVLTTAAPDAQAVTQWPPSLKTALEPFGLSAPTLISGT